MFTKLCVPVFTVVLYNSIYHDIVYQSLYIYSITSILLLQSPYTMMLYTKVHKPLHYYLVLFIYTKLHETLCKNFKQSC